VLHGGATAGREGPAPGLFPGGGPVFGWPEVKRADQWELIEPYVPIGEYGPYPERLRDRFEGVVRRFRSGAQWRGMPGGFGPWATVHGRFRVWRNAVVLTALLEGLITEAARQGKTDLSPGRGRHPGRGGRAAHPMGGRHR
jgi:transposase